MAIGVLRRGLRLLADYRAAAQVYGTSLPALLRQTAHLALRRGLGWREALSEGLLDPALPEGARAACIGKARLLALQSRVNPPARECVTEDKSLFYPYCLGLGLPVPALFAVLGRHGGYTATGRAISDRAEWVRFLAGDLPEDCVVKPAFGYYGLGVRVLRRVGGEFADQEGRSLSPAALYDELASDRRFRKFVFQQRLAPHPDLVRLSGSRAVQTIRVVTVVEDGKAEVNHAFLRIAVGENQVDNFRAGQTGNVAARVDVANGCLREGWAAGTTAIVRLTRHPDTGVALDGFRLPLWEEVRSLAERAAVVFLPMRCIGWDMALTPSGPSIIEGNMWWDPSNLFALDLTRPSEGGQAALLARLAAVARGGGVDSKG
jgi:hypothetical protein